MPATAPTRSEPTMKRIQQGFTLIELMIVVAIIGILASVALPAYQDYTLKSKVANVFRSTHSIKTAIASCFAENGGTLDFTINGVPGNCYTMGANGIPVLTPTKEVSTVILQPNGRIIVRLASDIGTGVSNGFIVMTPTFGTAGSAVVWTNSTFGITSDAVRTQVLRNNV
jgi:type IV pilus assembly protein PilA